MPDDGAKYDLATGQWLANGTWRSYTDNCPDCRQMVQCMCAWGNEGHSVRLLHEWMFSWWVKELCLV